MFNWDRISSVFLFATSQIPSSSLPAILGAGAGFLESDESSSRQPLQRKLRKVFGGRSRGLPLSRGESSPLASEPCSIEPRASHTPPLSRQIIILHLCMTSSSTQVYSGVKLIRWKQWIFFARNALRNEANLNIYKYYKTGQKYLQ